jgi:hypothetical protein
MGVTSGDVDGFRSSATGELAVKTEIRVNRPWSFFDDEAPTMRTGERTFHNQLLRGKLTTSANGDIG